jgi:hypothetical protein
MLSIGTGYQEIAEDWRAFKFNGALGWVLKGRLVQTAMNANRSSTETVARYLTEFTKSNVDRFRFNVTLTRPSPLDDPEFVATIEREWNDFSDGRGAAALQAMLAFHDLHFVKSRIPDRVPDAGSHRTLDQLDTSNLS